MKAQQKKLSGCASNLLAHEDLGHFEEAHHWNIQAKFYNEKFPLSIWKWQHRRIMKIMVLFWSTSVEKEIVALSLLSFSLISFFLFGPSSFFGLFFSSFFHPESHPDLWGNHSLHHPFLTWDNALIMMIITLLFFLQLNNYNSILRTKYDFIWMPPAVYRDMQWIMSDMYERIMNSGFATNTMSTTWSC